MGFDQKIKCYVGLVANLNVKDFMESKLEGQVIHVTKKIFFDEYFLNSPYMFLSMLSIHP